MSSILVVDDNEQNLYMLQILLEGNGHSVVTAGNGADALERALESPPTLIISDILMPVMDGFALCREWQKEKRLQSIPFVFYTATYTGPQDEKLALDLGAARFIVKPADPVIFVEIIRDVFRDFNNSRLPPVVDGSLMNEEVYLKEYNERLIHKLEQKTLALEEEIAERKRTEKQLRHAQKMEAIGTLAGGIAHDFNNILTAIIGFSEIAKSQLAATDKVSKDLDIVISAGHRAASLVEQILTFSRQEEDDFSVIDIRPVIRESLELLSSILPQTIEVHTRMADDCGLVLANATQIQQVLMNLCNNATQAIGDAIGRIDIVLSGVTFSRSDIPEETPEIVPGRYLHLKIVDNGCGMDEVSQTRVFEPFFTTKAKGEGTGLGLAVVHGIIKQHKGAIFVNSKSGHGTVFHVYLPVADNATRLDIPNEQMHTGDMVEGSEKILFVDDEPYICEMVQRMLSRLGYTVVSFTSSREALEVYTAQPDNFDIVVTDMTMPEMDGIHLAEKMLLVNKDLPVVLCTGFGESVNSMKSKSAAIRACVRKPIIHKVLAQSVRKVLDEDRPSCRG